VNLVIEGKEYCREPFERVFDGRTMRKVTLQNKIDGRLARSYTDLHDGANVLLLCGSSESVPIPDSSVDAVVTDPPYFGNVMYSELSNFFYVWLRIGLKEKYQEFRTEYVPWIDEIIENRIQAKGRNEYIHGLVKVLSESKRVLIQNGILVFTFHHTKLSVWGALLEALLQSGFYITATYPVRSEMKASTHLHEMENIAYDMVFVCRKKTTNPATVQWSTLRESVVQSVAETLKGLQKNGQSTSRQDLFALALGKLLQFYSEYYPSVKDGDCEVCPDLALSLIEADTSGILQSGSMCGL
jgi:adenine-specific DNA methylase